MTSAKQRAAARRNIKKAQAALRRRGGKKSHRSRRSYRGKSVAHASPKMGAAYLNASRGLQIAAPLTDTAIVAAQTKALPSAGLVQAKVLNGAYAGNLAVTLADSYLDAKTHQAAAISRGSLTAVAPEVYRALVAYRAGSVPAGHAAYVRSSTAYDPSADSQDFSDADFRTYRILKHGGQAVRYVVNQTELGKRLARPLKKALGAVGVSA